MDDRTMRLQVLRVLEAIDFEQRERWARRIVCSSLGVTALALGLSGCLPPGPMPGRGEPAPIAQPDLGGCFNCEYAAPIPIDRLPKPKYAADLDTPRPAYAVEYPIPVPPYSVAMPPDPRPLPVPAYGIRPDPSPSVSKYGVAVPQSKPAINNEPVARYAILSPRQ